MHPLETFEAIVGMLVAILALHWLAGMLRWPPSIALLIGGGALPFIPGLPIVRLDPDLVLVLFLPPLLMDGAWSTDLARFRRHLGGILALAIGAVAFTTLVVAWVAHWLMPALPWAACAALGAIVAPPDAVSARAILARVKLPRRLSTLLEGESLLNDAAGLVLFRFAVAAAMGGAFDPGAAVGRFAVLAIGGALVGLAIGQIWVRLARFLDEDLVIIVATVLVCWIAYLVGEALHVSGVIATVAAGLVLGWHQHVIFTAAVRIRGVAFWSVLVFLFEAMVFMLIGFALRDILQRVGGIRPVLEGMAWPLLAILLALTAARFVWVFGSDLLVRALSGAGLIRTKPLGATGAMVMSWAGMRGVVTLAVALTLPETMPGRDFMLIAAFGVIFATVVLQGATLGVVIRRTGVRPSEADEAPMGMMAAEMAMMRAQLAAVERLARDETGALLHPQLLQRYTRRTAITENYTGTDEERSSDIAAHFGVILGAVEAGRRELVRLHRAHQIDDETLHSLERDLDLEELAAISAQA